MKSITNIGTQGGEVIICGHSFGPSADSVRTVAEWSCLLPVFTPVRRLSQVAIAVGGRPCVGTRMTVPFMELVTNVPPGVGTQSLRLTVRPRLGDGVSCEVPFSYAPPMLVSCSATDTHGGVITVRCVSAVAFFSFLLALLVRKSSRHAYVCLRRCAAAAGQQPRREHQRHRSAAERSSVSRRALLRSSQRGGRVCAAVHGPHAVCLCVAVWGAAVSSKVLDCMCACRLRSRGCRCAATPSR